MPRNRPTAGRVARSLHLLARSVTLALGLSLSAASVQAGDGPVVVELYTSQGCSSCPPVDAFLAEHLAGRPDVLALALHVDYWDYIGWKDAFADSAFTDRQKAYAQRAGHRTIYTPQMIIGGQDAVVGYRPMEVAELIADQRARPDPVVVSLSRNGTMATIRAVAHMALPRPGASVQLVEYAPHREVTIERGENAGRTLSYANVVTRLSDLGDWDGTSPFEVAVEVAPNDGLGVIVQLRGLGPVLGAAKLP